MPDWLVRMLQRGTAELNEHGGLSVYTPFRPLSCLPGDVIILNEDGPIEICAASEFTQRFQPLAA